MATRLKSMMIDFISLVPRGANAEAEIVLAKRDDNDDLLDEFTKTDPGAGSVHVDTPLGSKSKRTNKPDKENTVGKNKEYLEEEDEMEEEEEEEEMEKGVGTTDSLGQRTLNSMNSNGLPSGLPPEAIAYIEKLEDLVMKMEDEAEVEDDLDLDTLAKADPVIASLLEKYESAEARATEAENIAWSERDTRITSEMITKAQGYAHLGPVEELASVLKELHDTDSDLYASVDAILAKAETAVASGSLFTEVGKSSGNGVGSDLDAIAKSLQTADPTLTSAQAITKALNDNPHLYTGGN